MRAASTNVSSGLPLELRGIEGAAVEKWSALSFANQRWKRALELT
jgi:hypothetical protein